jgi:archaellum biogenesis ATPase FlaH
MDELPDGYGLLELLNSPRREIAFYVDRFIPKNTITLLAGESGIGKSHVLISVLLSMLSDEEAFGCLSSEAAKVQYFSEDDGDILRPYVDRIMPNHEVKYPELLRFEQNVVGYEDMIKRIKVFNPELVIIDPLVVVMDIDDNREREVSKFVRTLYMLARERNMAIVFTRHMSKPSAGVVYTRENIFSRVLGSQAFVASTKQRIVLWREAGGTFTLSVKGKYNAEWHSRILIDTSAGKILLNANDVTGDGVTQKVRKSKYHDAILEVLSRDEDHEFSPHAVTVLMEKWHLVDGEINADAVRKEMARMDEKNLIIKTDGGKYKHVKGIGQILESKNNPRFATPLSTSSDDEMAEE